MAKRKQLSERRRLHTLFRLTGSIVAGNAVIALAISVFFIPHGILVGGTTGIGLAAEHFFGIHNSVTVLILNIGMLLLGWAVLGKGYAATIVLSSFLFPLFLAFFQELPVLQEITEDMMLACIAGGMLMGAGLGILLSGGSSSGGTDTLALIINRWTHLPLSGLVWAIDLFSISLQVPFSDKEQIIYAALTVVLYTTVMNRMLMMGKRKMQVFVVSESYEAIRDSLLHELHAGATLLQIETGCGHEAQKGVLSIMPARKIYAAKTLILSVDPDAFITVSQVSEVNGRGFTTERIEYEDIQR